MKYSYRVLKNNNVTTGSIEAESQEKVIEYLKYQNLTIISIKKNESLFSSGHHLISRVSSDDVVNFTRQLAIMLNAGLTIVESLDIIKKQTSNPALYKVIDQIDQSVRSGQSFSGALKEHKHLFNNLYISLIKAGEASGKLDEILVKLADNLEKRRLLKSKLKGTLIYPVIIVVGMLGVMLVMVVFVLPQLLTLYDDFNIALPLSTQLLISLSNLLRNFWYVFVIGGILLGSLAKRYIQTKQGKILFDNLIIRMPILGKVISMSALVDSTRTLSILIGSGVSILEALDIIIETSGNAVYHNAFSRISKKIEKGATLGKSLNDEGIFPAILVQMSTVGEQTGHLDDTLMRISKYFETESELAIKAMTTLIEPLILVFLGIGVGVLVYSIITPIYKLTTSFG